MPRALPETGAALSTTETARPGRMLDAPPAALLTNGRYVVFITASGSGSSALEGCALTRWRGDPIEDRDGFYFYLRDLDRGELWSLGDQPVRHPPERYRARWRPGRFEIDRRDHDIEARLEVGVAPEANVEMRRITLRNDSREPRRIEVTSWAEVVLQDAVADAHHPAFSKLFVQTEFVAGARALLARRRPRASAESHPWLAHVLLGEGELEYETDRGRFVGRGRSLAAPLALCSGAPLSGTTGDVLDPILSLRRRVTLAPGESAELVYLLAAEASRTAVLEAIDGLRGARRIDEAFVAAEERERETLARLGVEPERAAGYQALMGAVVRGDPSLRAAPEVLARAQGTLAVLDRYEIERHRPLAVFHARGSESIPPLATWLRALRYGWAQGWQGQLLVLCDNQDELPANLLPLEAEPYRLRRHDEIEPGDLVVISAAARLVGTGPMPEVTLNSGGAGSDRALDGASPRSLARPRPRSIQDESLSHFNGYGGFNQDGTEYVIRLGHGPEWRLPPRPWINVLANPSFGCLVSETGAGCTWGGNSREHRLTPWVNDPLLDPHDDALYLRDEESGAVWSPLPGPVRGEGGYEVRHGFGYSTWQHRSQNLLQETCVFVPRHDPLRVVRIRVTNQDSRVRRLSVFGYQRLVLGTLPEESARFVVTEIDSVSNAVFARNPLAGPHRHRVAFATAVVPPGSPPPRLSCDRAAFIGYGNAADRPAALERSESRAELESRAGAGLDPCFVEQVSVKLLPGESVELGFLLGEAESRSEAAALIERYRTPGEMARALAENVAYWKGLLAGVQIETPAPALDLMANGWLAYQTLSSRMWGRTALYQSSGAFGFRDQLQDSSALVWLAPPMLREQILLHAAHQFVEGDVMHWWHPPEDRGIRTRFADDLLWLPYVTSGYVAATGDWDILAEIVRFLSAPPLEAGEDETLVVPQDSGTRADVYQHCCRAIDRSLGLGAHGLPRFGSGDWNDGMNRVGREGRGESVWMGFFLYAVLGDFLPLCEHRGDRDRARAYRDHRERLRDALNDAGWDGEWYLRGFYDDGTPLGSSHDDECRIDALVQAWAVLSGAAPPERARQAMAALERHLVDEQGGLIRLLTPPFRNTPHDPGYIKGYVAGVRENGGQYTHAALWVVRAMAELGWNDRAARLLEMLSPIDHARTAEQVERYQVEPYVVAADVYGEPPHVGRGGWTWYTGSSGWMLRVCLESVLGLKLVHGASLSIKPCIPATWPAFAVTLRGLGEAGYYVQVSNRASGRNEVVEARLDGEPVEIVEGAARVPIVRDGREHRVEVILG